MTEQELDALVKPLVWTEESPNCWFGRGYFGYQRDFRVFDGVAKVRIGTIGARVTPDRARGFYDKEYVEFVLEAIDRDAITTLRAQLADAHTRIEAMESGDWSELKLVRFENGQMDITCGPIPAIAEYLAQMMQDGEGKYFNFMEVSINHNTAGPMTLSLQRKNGKTPNQLRKEAEARANRAEAALAAQIEVDAGIAESFNPCAATAIRNQPRAGAAEHGSYDRTALDAVIRAAKVEAWKEAAHVDWSHGVDVLDIAPEYLSPWQRGLVAGQAAIRAAILALIEREGV